MKRGRGKTISSWFKPASAPVTDPQAAPLEPQPPQKRPGDQLEDPPPKRGSQTEVRVRPDGDIAEILNAGQVSLTSPQAIPRITTGTRTNFRDIFSWDLLDD